VGWVRPHIDGWLGKITLAQHVYNDPKIHDAKFDIKAWVCVSDQFHVLNMTRTILEAVTDKLYSIFYSAHNKLDI